MFATKMTLASVPTTFAGVRRASAPTKAARRSMIVRASEEKPSTEAPATESAETVFYAGNTFNNEAEFKQAVANGTATTPAPAQPTPAPQAALGFGDLMAFSGPAPELINSRLAMLGIVAALGAEISSGESVLRQLADEPTGIILAFVTFAVASLIPLLSSTKREAFGPFTPAAEITNGRAAMIGFASLLVIEGLKGSALF